MLHLHAAEKSQPSKSDPILIGRIPNTYINETLIDYSQLIPTFDQARQNKEREKYYVLVVTVPQTTTSRPQRVQEPEIEIGPWLLNPTEDIPPFVTTERTAVSETPAPAAQEKAPVPSLINSIGNVLVHTIRGNFSGIVDESFGTGVSTPLVTVLNNLLSDSSCNTIRRLLGQCRTQGTETLTQGQRTLFLSVAI